MGQPTVPPRAAPVASCLGGTPVPLSWPRPVTIDEASWHRPEGHCAWPCSWQAKSSCFEPAHGKSAHGSQVIRPTIPLLASAAELGRESRKTMLSHQNTFISTLT